MSDTLLNVNLRKSETLFKREVQQRICCACAPNASLKHFQTENTLQTGPQPGIRLSMCPRRKSETLSDGKHTQHMLKHTSDGSLLVLAPKHTSDRNQPPRTLFETLSNWNLLVLVPQSAVPHSQTGAFLCIRRQRKSDTHFRQEQACAFSTRSSLKHTQTVQACVPFHDHLDRAQKARDIKNFALAPPNKKTTRGE